MVTSTSSTTNNNGSIGSSIVSALGSGSGIDSNKLADQLTEANKMVQAQRLTSQKTLLQTQISDYGLLRSSLAKLETAAAALGSADTFNAKALSVPDTSLIGITKLDSKAVAGSYQLKVEQVAQAQSLSSASFAAMTSPVGKGTLTIRLGDWNAGNTAFTVDSTKTGGTITIDDSNNSLTGLRDAINAADIGVSASIVSDGGSYRLLMTASTGAKNEIEVVATEDPAAVGLAAFNFNETTKNLTQQQEGLDAQIRVNGLLVSRESNQVKDVIDGLEFDLFTSSATETISLVISEDKSVAEQTIRDFVQAYNTFKAEVDVLVGFDAELDDFGSLKSDPLAKNLMQSIRNVLTNAVPGIGEGFSTLSNLGIRTELDGTLKIYEDDSTGFRAAIDDNFEFVRDLFVPKASSSVSNIDVTKFSARSQPGSYEVVITQQPSKGTLTTTDPVDLVGIGSGTKDYSFTFQLNGITSNAISLPAGKQYGSGAELAADLQSLINLDANVKAANASVAVTFEGGKLVFTSASYGASSTVNFSAVSADMLADFGMTNGVVVSSGTDVAGTVDGVAAFGSGNILLPAIGSKAEGLSMMVEPGATTGTLTFTRGFAGSMSSLVNEFLKTSGLIKERETTIDKDIKRVEQNEEALERRSEAYRARLMAQFQAMESIVRALNTTGGFLDGIVDRLPFTAKS
ncbi:flagellar filament capping protein FliD [Cellvibrio sp. KY-YJ-3]|jgi:flagellar hook-associated protein 2|uniref:flagellar filament capping protein FliD n=1 Tax=Cellvibrio sp. KY-YJ-3 TaxID=454662 RepID=UPI001247DDFA|nr:flagellar filament capping protein FliD [Cellvibrio sp. KY-YJ-3]QEY13098.1 flagellar hook protein [Cellvibrio sp. KY-YJ-3]